MNYTARNRTLTFYAISLGLLPAVVHADALSAQDIYKKMLPSIMTLHVAKKDGSAVLGTGFMAVKDGMAVTAWHVVRDATHVSAHFSDGEDFDASGLVDKDEKRDLALIKIKVAGRALLSLSPSLPDIGSKAYVIGAPKGLEFSISDGLVSQIQNDNGVKLCQFTCPASPGNSGGPLFNDTGEVIGIVSRQYSEGQNLNFAIPSTYALGLDATLPTQPWETVETIEVAPPVEVPKAALPKVTETNNDDLDRLFAACLVTQFDFRTEAAYLNEHIIRRKGGFMEGVPPDLYRLQKEARDEVNQLAHTPTSDPNRETIRRRFYDEMGDFSSFSYYMARAINECIPMFGWTSFANDDSSKAWANFQAASSVSPAEIDAVTKSEAFRESLPQCLRNGFYFSENFGANVWAQNDLLFVVVPKGSTAERMGLNTGDTVWSVEGKMLTNLDDFYQAAKKHSGEKMKIVVIRNGKGKDLDAHVPQTL